MKITKYGVLIVAIISMVWLSGCSDELRDCRIQNDRQRKLIDELQSELQTKKLELDQCVRQVSGTNESANAQIESLQQKLGVLQSDIAKKEELIAAMQQQLLHGGIQLPPELNVKLEEFAAGNPDLITFDSQRGVVKFKSDLLFEKGSATVSASAAESVKALSNILADTDAEQFDIIVAGHTDDVPILKPATKQKHPSNWHLSAHRAISVLNIMAKNGIASPRISVRGFGEFRPVEPNKEGKKGNPANRRVEIYIVQKGM